MTERNIHIGGIVDIMENPVKIVKVSASEWRYYGRQGMVIYNPTKNTVVTVWRKGQ